MTDKKEKTSDMFNPTTIATAESALIQQHGEAASQMVQAYKGVRVNSAGETEAFYGRSLKEISRYHVNPDYAQQNIQQQAGFSAELVEEARQNKQAILSSDPIRARTSDGLGMVNDPINDLVNVIPNGNIVDGSGVQVKFYGEEPPRCELIDKNLNKDVIKIPKGATSEALNYLDTKIQHAEKRLETLKEKGSLEKCADVEKQIKKYRSAKLKIQEEDTISFKDFHIQKRYKVVTKFLNDDSWDRYEKISVPHDEFFEIWKDTWRRLDKYEKAAERCEARGDYAGMQKNLHKADRCRKFILALEDSQTGTKDAIDARTNPLLFTVKEVATDSHQAGVIAAKGAMVMGGAISFAMNTYQVASGEKDIPEAAKDVAISVAGTGATAYAMGATGTAMKAVMHSAQSDVVKKLSTTNFPAMVVSGSVEISRILRSYIRGEVTEAQAVEQLGEKGVGTIAASYGAVVGTAFLPVVGTAVGSMVGYTVSSMLYNSCLQILQDADFARDNYYATKEMCERARKSMKEQRLAFEKEVQELLNRREKTFSQAIPALMDALEGTETDRFTDALSAIAAEFGRELPYKNEKDFFSDMDIPDAKIII